MEIKSIASLIPIQLYLQKLSGRNQLKIATLPYNHIIKLLLERNHTPNSIFHYLTLKNMTSKQQQKIKNLIVDINN